MKLRVHRKKQFFVLSSHQYVYDACGRLIAVESSAGVTSLSWDYEDRLVGITYPNQSTNSFGYNGFGARVSKSDSTGNYTFLRGGTAVVSPVLDDGSAAYTPGISERRGSDSKFYHSDLKNMVAQTASNETVSGTNEYDAFGNIIDYSGTWSGQFAYGGVFGYQSDDDSGLMLLGHRYYDASTGRFLSRDPVGDGGNWYVYCRNNPVRYQDENGLIFSEAVDLLLGERVLDDPLDPSIQVIERRPFLDWVFGDYAVTLSSRVIILPSGVSADKFLNSPDSKYINWYNHEAAHVEQARLLGPFYLLQYFSDWITSGFSYSNHPMEIAARLREKQYDGRRVPPKEQRPVYDIGQYIEPILPTKEEWFNYLRGR